MSKEKRRQFEALLQQRIRSSEHTRIELHEALDRFESGNLIYLSLGSKLTLRNLALEAGGMSKDTPLSRYRKNQDKAGEFRFPDIASRFKSLKYKELPHPDSEDPQKVKIRKLREERNIVEEKLQLSARANNQLDAENYRLKQRNKELEKQNAQLRQSAMKIVPSIKGKKH
jgi:hypothetical protein